MPPNEARPDPVVPAAADERRLRAPSRRVWPWATAVVILAALAAGVWYWTSRPAAEPQATGAPGGGRRSDASARPLPVVAAPVRKG